MYLEASTIPVPGVHDVNDIQTVNRFGTAMCTWSRQQYLCLGYMMSKIYRQYWYIDMELQCVPGVIKNV